jgi:hypothetical protein
MTRLMLIAIPFAALAMLAGCKPQQPIDLMAIRLELTALKQEFEFLREQTEELDPRVRFSEQLALQAISDRDAPSRLDCVAGTIALVSTRLTALPATCDAATPIPGGYRLRLKVGNPTAARIEGLQITLYAGPGATRGRSDKRMFTERSVTLAAGAWTIIEVDFVGLDLTELTEVAIRTQVDRVALGL